MAKQNLFMTVSNKVTAWILRSPMHGLLSKSTMIVSVTGSRSGLEITTPVNYLVMDGSYYTLSSRDRQWWRNLRGGKPCKLWLNGKITTATGSVYEDNTAVSDLLGKFVQAAPAYARYLGIRKSVEGLCDRGDLIRAAESRVVVCFTLLKDMD